MIHCEVDRYETWRHAAFELLRDCVPPQSICWEQVPGRGPFFGVAAAAERTSVVEFEGAPNEPLWAPAASAQQALKQLLQRVEKAACHRDAGRWELFYRLLWRLTQGDAGLLKQRRDVDVQRLATLGRGVTVAVRRMQGEVEFQEGLPGSGGYALAWHRPEHAVLPRVAPHFVRAFPLRPFALLTPDESVEWDGRVLQFGPGVPLTAAPRNDELLAAWRRYHERSFRPDRLTLRGVADVELELPSRRRRPSLVFVTAAEQPVNESRCARQILAEALADVGLDFRRVQVLDLAERFAGSELPAEPPTRRTRAGRRAALADELARLRPRMLVTLGAVAAQLLFGRDFRVSRQHGQVFASPWAAWSMATYHPAALVRVPDLTVRARMQEQFLFDLHRVAEQFELRASASTASASAVPASTAPACGQ